MGRKKKDTKNLNLELDKELYKEFYHLKMDADCDTNVEFLKKLMNLFKKELEKIKGDNNGQKK